MRSGEKIYCSVKDDTLKKNGISCLHAIGMDNLAGYQCIALKATL